MAARKKSMAASTGQSALACTLRQTTLKRLRAKSLVIQTHRTKQLNRKHLKLEHCKCSAFLVGGDTISFLANGSNNTYYVKFGSENRERGRCLAPDDHFAR